MDNTGRKQAKRVGFTKANRTSNGKHLAETRKSVRITQGNWAKTMDTTGRKQEKRVGFMKANRTSNAGVKAEEIRKGRILEGVQGYLEGIFRDPSLTTKSTGKACKNNRICKKHLRKAKENFVLFNFP